MCGTERTDQMDSCLGLAKLTLLLGYLFIFTASSLPVVGSSDKNSLESRMKQDLDVQHANRLHASIRQKRR